MQYALRNLLFPAGIKLNLLIKPALKPAGLGKPALDGVVRVERLVHMQVGGMQGLSGSMGRGHENPNF